MQNAVKLKVDAGVRYWEDATVNGVEDVDGGLMFGAHGCDNLGGGRWRISILLADGRIEDWPQGTIADIHYKVCDDGEYWLADADGKPLAKWGGCYVPSAFLCHGENNEGYGDYIIFSVDAGGRIVDYKRPEIIPDEWRAM